MLELVARERLRALRARPLPREAGPGARGERALQARELAAPRPDAVPRPGSRSRRTDAALRAVVQRVSARACASTPRWRGRSARALLLARRRRGDDEARSGSPAKIARLRIFADDDGSFDRSLLDTGGGALVVSQFTLLADTAKGNRPCFSRRGARPRTPSRSTSASATTLESLGVPVGGRLRRKWRSSS